MKFRLTHPDLLIHRRRELGLTIKGVADISRLDYSKVQNFERGLVKKVEAPTLEAVCYALGLNPLVVSEDYEPPFFPRFFYVAVDGKRVAAHMEAKGENAVEFARRAGVDKNLVYGLTRYNQETIPADAARKIAKAMALRGFELAPALGIFPGPDGEPVDEFYGRKFGQYGGETLEDVSSLQ